MHLHMSTYDLFANKFYLVLKGNISHLVELGGDSFGNITRMNNVLDNIQEELQEAKYKLEVTEKNLEKAKTEINTPFPKEQELSEKNSSFS